MTYLDAYIGNLDDPNFKWDGGNWNGNVPKRVSPFFPPTHGGRGMRRDAFSEVIALIQEGSLEGKQTDWGGWVAKADKVEIVRFMDSLYDETDYPPESPLAHIGESIREMTDFVENLPDDGKFALVATEL